MLNLALFNFILYSFDRAAVPSTLFLHCWQPAVLKTYGDLASSHAFYIQYVETRQLRRELNEKFKERFFNQTFPSMGVFLDINCPQAEEIIKAASSNRIFSNHFIWILYDDKADMGRFYSLFETLNVTVDSDVTYVITETSYLRKKENATTGNVFTLYDVYNNGPHIGGKLNITADRRIACSVVGCEIDRYLTDLHKRSKYGNRDSQRDITLRIAVVITYPPISLSASEKFQFLRSEKDPNYDAHCRFGFHQIDILKDMLQSNFTFTFHNAWSLTDLFGGAVGEVSEERADITSSPLTISLIRLKHYIPVVESAIFHSICMFRTPPKSGLGNSGQVFLEPFSSTVWVMFGILLLVTAVQLWAIFIIEHYSTDYTSDYVPSLLTTCLITFGSACSQGSFLLPGSVSGRISYSTLVLASFIMYNYYTSIIVSSLLGSPVKSDINTLAQLADSSLEVAFEPIPFHFAFLNNSQETAVRRLVQRKINDRKNPYDAWMPAVQGVLGVRDKKGFVYGFEASTGYALVEKYYKPEEICDLNEMYLRPERSLSNIILKNSSYKELFRLRFIRTLETGINRKLLKLHLRNKLECMFSSSFVDVGMEYAGPLFVMLLASFILCWLLLMCEIFWHTYISSKFQHYVDELKKLLED